MKALGVDGGCPVLVSIGGAAGMDQAHLQAIAEMVQEHIVPAVERAGAAVVDGGTRSGIMEVMGSSRAAVGARFPLVGVAAVGTINPPLGTGSRPEAADVDPHHSHVVLVPGNSWGDESPWLSTVAEAIARGSRSVTLVVNGGDITYDDVARSIAAERPVIVVAGSGRAADALATAMAEGAGDVRSLRLVASPLMHVVSLADPHGVVAVLEATLQE
jgi:SLOG in TRPM, prokaryote